MAKREIKAVSASEDVAAIIDRGSDVDAQIKNLGFEDKGIKIRIVEAAQNQMDEGELSVRLVGRNSAAIVSGVEKIELNRSAEKFPQVREAIDNGLLTGIVERSVGLAVPPADIERAAKELLKLGIKATVTETLKVSADVVRNQTASGMTASIQEADAIKVLRECLSRDVSFRVKYDKV